MVPLIYLVVHNLIVQEAFLNFLSLFCQIEPLRYIYIYFFFLIEVYIYRVVIGAQYKTHEVGSMWWVSLHVSCVVQLCCAKIFSHI